MKGFDFGIDLDGEKGKLVTKSSQVYKDAVKLKGILDDFELPYSPRFSGNKGLHFLIKDCNLPNLNPMDRGEIVPRVSA